MSRTRTFLYNSIFAALYQIVVLVAGFIIPKVMLNVYGSEINGLVSSITQFITYFSLVEAGLSGAAVYALYDPLAKKNCKKISGIVSAVQKLYSQAGILFIILLMVLTFVYPMYIKSASLTVGQVRTLVIVLGTSGILEFFTLGKYRALLTANQELYVISFASIIYQALSVFIIVVLSYYKYNIIWVRLISLTAVFARTLILILYTRKKYYYVDYKEKPLTEALNKRWDALYLQILGAIHSGAPIILATFYTNLLSVSVYTIYNMILGGIGGVVGIFTNGLSSSFGEIIVKNENTILKKTYSEFETAYYTLISIIYGITVIMILPFIKLYTSNIMDVEYNNTMIAILFVLNGFLYNLKIPQGMLVISAGHYKETRIQTTIQGLIAVLGGTVMAPSYGLAGILVASIVSNSYRCIDLLYYVPKKIVHSSIKKTFFRMFISSAEFGVCIVFSFLIPVVVQTWMDWISMAILVTILISAFVLIFNCIFESNEMKMIIKRCQRLLSKNQIGEK